MLLPLREHRLFKVNRWVRDSASPDPAIMKDTEEVTSLDEADIVSSELFCGFLEDIPSGVAPPMKHRVMLDIDVPAVLVPSSTPGHHHLYIDVYVTWDKYVVLLDALADCGVVERGYVSASKERGFTAVRLPWVRRKTPREPDIQDS